MGFSISQFKEKIIGSAKSDAQELKDLRAKRLKLEGRSKILAIKDKEKKRIAKAKGVIKEHSTVGKVTKFLKEAKKDIDKNKGSGSSPWRDQGKKDNNNPWR